MCIFISVFTGIESDRSKETLITSPDSSVILEFPDNEINDIDGKIYRSKINEFVSPTYMYMLL